jgi:hypothetical protein
VPSIAATNTLIGEPKVKLHLTGLLLIASASAWAAPVINVYTTLAPELIGPSGTSWINNAVYALEHGLSSYGDPNLPDYYVQRSEFSSNENIISLFPSWHGQINPGTVFGPAFAGELGNRIHFGVAIDGNGTQFSISQLSYHEVPSDPTQVGLVNFAEGTYQYSSAYVGIVFGSTHSLYAADNTYITSGPNTQLVDAVVGRGSGVAWLSCNPAGLNCSSDAERQASLDHYANSLLAPYTLTGTYSLAAFDASGSAVATVNPVPEPVGTGVAGLGVVTLAAFIRRRRSR